MSIEERLHRRGILMSKQWLRKWAQVPNTRTLHLRDKGGTRCGIRKRLTMPGLLDRLVASRCYKCCKISGDNPNVRGCQPGT